MRNFICLILLFCGACKTQAPQNNCADLFLGIKKNFLFNKTTQLYYFSNNRNWDFLKEVYTNHSCLAQLNQSQLQKLFGKPSAITTAANGAETFWYKLTANFVAQNPPYYSSAFYLELTKEGRLKHADFSTNDPKP